MSASKRFVLAYAKDKLGDWRWNIKHGNGRILAASSEGFRTKYGARRNLNALRTAFFHGLEE